MDHFLKKCIEFKFNQKAWLKPYIDMNTKLRKETKKYFKKDFFKLMNNAVFGKTMENVRKHRDIKLVTTYKRRKYLVLEPYYHTTKWFFRGFVGNRNEKKVKMNKPVYLGLSILEISNTLMLNCGMIISNQSIIKMKNYATWIQIVLSFMSFICL